MFALITEGNMDPSAAVVAQRAEVSARTVFRHFEEMDSLYAEMTARIEAEILPIVQQPFAGDTWREQLDQLIARRATIYDKIMPLKIAASIRRFSSEYLMANYQRFLDMERMGLERVIPKAMMADATLLSAIEMCVGFQAWRRLRQDQGLSSDAAVKVVRLCITRLLG
ncbi:TetR/AcrR family transcriptional regulator [Blastomonas sp.]|uniref:TetR/AcrR family transcriptional regulator n=1 Tax=Blastomonas sp. TaxID=1909299 RepID=UPI003593068A